ncbi:uncharacterized protein LOC126746784 isoform X3 [Anthonomus grandis grandis]|uniref:uncharacterized protein LOC126746784 isoform X3 n=1 Tax=Anthonomus grandis grandis TaxID=2921223 RepID=UPI002165E454|nr:uncharacterized protein LOC126746784 isoform X3 [Anthonomus grandis grandis]
MTMTTAKGYKVTDAARKTRVGIAVKSLEDLKKKTIDKFKLPHADINFQTPDGTLVESDEYFQTLPPQTLLIWVKRGERAETDAELLYKTIREVNEEYLSAGEKVQEFFTEKMKTKVFKLAEVLKGIDSDKVALSSREEHPEWFEENRIFVEQPEAERVATVDNNIHIESLPITIIDATMVTSNKTDLPYGATDFQNTYESCELVIQPETEPISSREQNDPQLHLNLLHQMTPVCHFLDHSDAEEDPFIGDDQLNDPDFIPPIETDSDRDSEEHIIPPKKTKINNQNSAGDNHPQPFAVLSKRCRKIRNERKDKRN